MGVCSKCGSLTPLHCASHNKNVCEACLVPGSQTTHTDENSADHYIVTQLLLSSFAH